MIKKNLLIVITFLLFNFIVNSQNQNISTGAFFEGEPYLAINPSNSQNIVIAWMGFVFANSPRLSIKVKSTFDGGETWSPAIIIPHIQSSYKSADPSLAFDGNSNLFLSFVDYRENPDSGGVYIVKSINGGLNWSAPSIVIDAYADGSKRPIDRPFLLIDESGENLYMTTKPAPWIAAQTDHIF